MAEKPRQEEDKRDETMHSYSNIKMAREAAAEELGKRFNCDSKEFLEDWWDEKNGFMGAYITISESDEVGVYTASYAVTTEFLFKFRVDDSKDDATQINISNPKWRKNDKV